MFRKLKFITMDLEFLESIFVLPPRHWKEIRDYGSSFEELLSWLSDVPSSGKCRKLYSSSPMQLDCFLCMCESSTVEYRIVFLYRFCRIHYLEFTAEFIIWSFSVTLQVAWNSLKILCLSTSSLTIAYTSKLSFFNFLSNFCSIFTIIN